MKLGINKDHMMLLTSHHMNLTTNDGSTVLFDTQKSVFLALTDTSQIRRNRYLSLLKQIGCKRKPKITEIGEYILWSWRKEERLKGEHRERKIARKQERSVYWPTDGHSEWETHCGTIVFAVAAWSHAVNNSGKIGIDRRTLKDRHWRWEQSTTAWEHRCEQNNGSFWMRRCCKYIFARHHHHRWLSKNTL